MPKVYTNSADRKNAYLIRTINGYLKENKMSVSRLADAINESRSTLYKKMRGEVRLTVDNLRDIREALDIPLEEIGRGL